MLNGTTFPPVIVYFDGADHWLGDGYHRVEAARKIKRTTITAEVREGTQRDALLLGIGANATHGLRRTQADKRRAVKRLLGDAEWSKWSDRQIAKVAKVDHKTVGKARRELLGGEIPTERTVLFRDRQGNQTEMRVNPPPGRRATPDAPSSVIEDFLNSVSDETLIDHCRRHGLRVEAPDAD